MPIESDPTLLYAKFLQALDRYYFQSEEFDNLETRIEVLEAAPIGDLAQIQSDVSDLETSQTTQDASITSLQGTSMVHTTNIGNNASAITALHSRVTQNETDIAGLGGGGGNNVTVENNGTPLTTDVVSLNFVGFNITEPVTDEITVTNVLYDDTTLSGRVTTNETDIANLQSATLPVQDEGIQIVADVSAFNFTGAGVTASNSSGTVTVNVPGGGGGGASVDDGVYGVAWNGDTTNAPSRNAVYDKIETMDTSISANAGNISTNTSNISSNDTDIATLTSTSATNGSNIAALDTRVTTNEGNISSLQAADDVITVQDEGVNLSTAVSTINFTGAGVTATGTTTVTVDIPGGGGSALEVLDEGVSLSSAVTSIDFTGAGVTATNTGGAVTVDVPSGGGGGGFTPTYALLNSTTSQTINQTTDTQLIWNVVVYDTGGYATNLATTNPNMLVIPANGVYIINCGVSTDRINHRDDFYVTIQVNGTNLYRTSTRSVNLDDHAMVFNSPPTPLNLNDQITVLSRNNNGTNSFTRATTTIEHWFAIYRII